MYNFEYPKKMRVGRVCVELSLKPFKQIDDAYIDGACRELFDGWRELIRYADSLAVMFFTSDGSEILQYSGDIGDEFEWGRYIGIGNPKKQLPPWDPDGISLHTRPVLYTKNPPVMHYSDLKRIISAVKRVGNEMYSLPVEVVETFDPGPEFAYSEFKFHRHPELNRGAVMDSMWIHCASRLHADNYKYASFPNGIPEGTHFGRFLALQFKALADDVGFDSIWLSNGFGYSLNSWNWTGELFDGKSFNYSNAPEIISSIKEFWEEFTAVTGDMRIEARGSNLTTGMDIAAHGSPIDDIYRYPLIAPPNSPWAALNYRFGLELAGYMSHIAQLPKYGFMFRFYTHDPWWHNSPWFDRYGSSPHDIYLPLAITRLDEEGAVTHPMGINFLTGDDSYGNMPRRCPVEVTPHLLNSYSHYPDEAGLVTWVYPFGYYAELGLREGHMERMFMDDWYIENAIDNGLPLNTVISDDNFIKAAPEHFLRTVLVMPVPQTGSLLEKAVLKACAAKLKLLLFGNPEYASDEVKNLIGITCGAEPLEGEVRLETTLYHDVSRDEMPIMLLHDALLSDGALTTEAVTGAANATSFTVSAGGIRRVYSTYNSETNVAWVRGSFPHARSRGSLPSQLDKSKYFHSSALMRGALEAFGVKIRFNCDTVTANKPIIFNSVCDNGVYITGFAKDTTMRVTLDYPDGAPLMIGTECAVDENGAEYPLSKCWHRECRFFIRQTQRSTVYTERVTAEHPTIDHRICLSGLKDAQITFYPPRGARIRMVLNNANMIATDNVEKEITCGGLKATAKHLTGTLFVSWQTDNNY